MSDSTPRTDEVSNRAWDGATGDYSPYAKMLNHSRQLERELATESARSQNIPVLLENNAKLRRELAEAQAELTRMQQENK